MTSTASALASHDASSVGRVSGVAGVAGARRIPAKVGAE